MPRSSSGLHLRGNFGWQEPKWTQDLLYLRFWNQQISEYGLAPNPISRLGCSRGQLWELGVCRGAALDAGGLPQLVLHGATGASGEASAGSFACRISAGNPVRLLASLLETTAFPPRPSVDVSNPACLARLNQVIWALHISGCRYVPRTKL